MLVVLVFGAGSGGSEVVRLVSESCRSAIDGMRTLNRITVRVLFDVRQESVAR
jgi:hypothetical protein